MLAPDVDETERAGEAPQAVAARLADAKAAAAATLRPDGVILAADTVVACGRRILPKAETAEQARACLELLSGRRHRVYGGIVVRGKNKIARRTVMTIVKFKRLSKAEIDSYVASGEWQGKAGGYGIQGRAAMFVASINGSYTNIVGLCVHTAANLLESFR